jgi:hypothetical protein
MSCENVIRVEDSKETVTFRPKGLFGRLYWYLMLPFHYFIFNGMIENIANKKYS